MINNKNIKLIIKSIKPRSLNTSIVITWAKAIIFKWVRREKLMLLMAFLILNLGVISPWYYLPKEALQVFEASIVWTNGFKIIPLLTTILTLTYLLFLPKIKFLRLGFWLSLLITLLFPYITITWQPKIAFLSANYYEQTQKVAYHVESNYSEVESQWKRNIILNKPALVSLLFEDISMKTSKDWQIPFWENFLFKGLGYTTSFFTFIGKGWMMTVVGTIFALMGLYLSWESKNLDIFLKDLQFVIPVTGIILGLIMVSLIGVNLINYQIDTNYALGEYSQVIKTSQALGDFYPPLRGNRRFVERLAKAEFYQGQARPNIINFLKGLELYRADNYTAAESYLQKSLALQPNQFLVRSYLALAILNQAVNDVNSKSSENLDKNYSSAINSLKKVLQIFPGHMEALYDLMLAAAVNGEFEQSAAIAKQIINEQKSWAQSQRSLLSQAYLHLAWAAYQNQDLDLSWERYRQSLTLKGPKESLDEE